MYLLNSLQWHLANILMSSLPFFIVRKLNKFPNVPQKEDEDFPISYLFFR